MEAQTSIDESFLKSLDDAWMAQSSALKSENHSLFVLQRAENENVQVQYRKVETITGPHIALFMLGPNSNILPIKKIISDIEKIQKVKTWLQRKKRFILVAGFAVSGKPTTVFSMMDELRQQEKVVFNLESSAPLVFDGVKLVEYFPRNGVDFAQNLLAVWAAKPNVIVFGMGETYSLENEIIRAASTTAKDGALAGKRRFHQRSRREV
ncbi:MAG: Flp pilus assembly complex ATPase component TadA [Bdellovibrio sp.]|nr:Flp pilus assembly complex ATPase component TadA [Bdellovibrio sp.]